MNFLKRCIGAAALMLAAAGAAAADYSNPILHADYSDPDVIRVGQMYYMTSSSFNNTPGLPLLQSSNMVHWELVGHALPQLVPAPMFARPQHGKGVWAPALRHHDGKFWIFYPDPDQGIYVMTATSFRGPWSAPHLLLAGKGIIDPAPLWDDDGKAWLVHGWAKSRSGINNIITLRSMAPDASRMLDEQGKVIINGDKLPNYHTLEGPKLHKHGGYYYVFAPAGSVEYGWQSVFRSRKIEGPYEDKVVMSQGSTPVNGPHQGAWVQTPEGKDWFYHFQDKGAYGRIVHLQPMSWKDNWPVIGEDKDGNGVGQPVLRHPQPLAAPMVFVTPPTNDDFLKPVLGLQWQWNANSQSDWYSLTARSGYLRLYSQHDGAAQAQDNLWNRSAILMQKLSAERFSTTTRLDLSGLGEGDSAGLVMYGSDYAWLGVKRAQGTNRLVLVNCFNALTGCQESTVFSTTLDRPVVYLRMRVEAGGHTVFSYSLDRNEFITVGTPFIATVGRWVGARMGLFSAASSARTRGYVDVDDFQVGP
jgi:beta-xylosidase